VPDDTGLALRLQDAFVTLGGRAILEGISLEVARGTILAVTGPNGAGKTTLLDLVAGEVPGTGAVEIDAPAGVARVLQSSPLPDTLTVEEVLELAAGRTGAAEQVAARYGFGDALAQTVTELSTGMRRILDLTVTMQQPHDVLLLDEPSSGVAEAELPHLVELVRQHRVRSGATIVLVEHRPELVHQLADQVLELRTPGPMVRGTPAGDVGPAQVDDVLSGVAAAGRPAPAPPRRTVSTWTKLRLGLRELAAGMSSVLALGVLNRVMKVELGITLVAVAALLASYNLAAPVALAIGHRSDRVPVLGRHRSPYIIGGACVSALALAVAPHVADRLAGGLRRCRSRCCSGSSCSPSPRCGASTVTTPIRTSWTRPRPPGRPCARWLRSARRGLLRVHPTRHPRQMLAEQTYGGHAGLHDEATAGSLGLSGAPIEGPTHLSQLDPLAHVLFGDAWFERGCVSAHFQTMVWRARASPRVPFAAPEHAPTSPPRRTTGARPSPARSRSDPTSRRPSTSARRSWVVRVRCSSSTRSRWATARAPR